MALLRILHLLLISGKEHAVSYRSVAIAVCVKTDTMKQTQYKYVSTLHDQYTSVHAHMCD